MSKKPPPPVTVTLELKDRGEVCPRRGVPLVDVYLNGVGGAGSIAQGCWLYRAGASLPFAEQMAAWFAERGAEVKREEASSEAECSRGLFTK